MNIDVDKILETGAKVVDSAKKTAVELAQKGKKQVDLLDAQAKKSKAERQLGALVYSLAKNGEENELLVKKYIDAIAAIEADIEELRKEVPAEEQPREAQPEAETGTAPEAPAAETGKKTCPQCGAEVEEDALFCNGCGAQL